MNIFWNTIFAIKKKIALNNTRVLCEHMLLVYNYFYSVNSFGPKNSFIKEAMGMLSNWEAVSGNIFKHKPTGKTIEIAKNEHLQDLTMTIIAIEIPSITKTKNQLMNRMLIEAANHYIVGYFKEHKIKGV